MLTPGLVSITFRSLAPGDIIGLARDSGLKFVEWGGDVHVPAGDFLRAKQVGDATRQAGLEISAYGSYYKAGDSGKEGVPFDRVLETALALGAPAIRVWAGAKGSGATSTEERKGVIDDLRRIIDLAADAGVLINLEYHGGTLTDCLPSTLELLREVDDERLLCGWQPPQGMAASTCVDELSQLLPRVAHVHVFHWWPGWNSKLPLAAGREVWPAYISLLRSTHRKIFLGLEFVKDESLEQFREDAATLRTWLQGDGRPERGAPDSP